MYIRNPGHMTKMAAMPIYGTNPSNIFFSRTGGPISTKLGKKHRWLKHYNVYINHDPVMPLTYFTARKWEAELNFNDSENNWTPGAHVPRGNIHVYFHNIQTSSPLRPLGQSKPNFM